MSPASFSRPAGSRETREAKEGHYRGRPAGEDLYTSGRDVVSTQQGFVKFDGAKADGDP